MRASLMQGFDLQSNSSVYTLSHLSWTLGINYAIVGPLSLGMETLICESHLQQPSNFWSQVDKNNVDFLIAGYSKMNSLCAAGDDNEFPGQEYALSSLK